MTSVRQRPLKRVSSHIKTEASARAKIAGVEASSIGAAIIIAASAPRHAKVDVVKPIMIELIV